VARPMALRFPVCRRSGALLYLALRKAQVAIAVDHGIAEIVPARALDAICRAARRGQWPSRLDDLRPALAMPPAPD
jgi:uncharacterized membrane protein